MRIKKSFKLLTIIVLIVVSGLAGCALNQSDVSIEPGEFVVNKRTGKIHSATCSSVKLMSDKNKDITSETLISLLKTDHSICRKCRAGIKKSQTEEMVDRLLHENLYVDDINIAATYADYISAIDEMGEWYTTHIPTYASILQTESLSKYSGNLKNYKEYELKNKGKTNSYIVLSSDKDAHTTSSLRKNVQILRGSENAVLNYLSDFNKIDFEKRIAYYPCDMLSQESDYNKPGDDCVRYLFAIFNMMDNQFTKKYTLLTKSSYSKTNSKKLATDYENIAFGLNNLGFKIYDTQEGMINVNNDTYPEGYISKIGEDFKLRKGDILAREGHVHIYLGDGISISADNFGWGRVYRSFPQNYEIKSDKSEGECYISLKNSSGEKEYYRRVYRYVGDK